MKHTILLNSLASKFLAVLLVATTWSKQCEGVGVTLITHGYAGNADGWVTAMANDIPGYYSFPGTNFSSFKITLTTDGSNYFYQWEPTNATPPGLTDSGEIIVKLDWSQMAGGLSAPYDISTYDVAEVATWVLLQTNSIPVLGGHALVEFPLHLIGHSRGGSLVSEISRLLGTNGLWVDQLTTLDPHPVNNDGFVDPLFVTDAPVRTYANVLFHDNYWEDINSYPWGEAVAGAYVRPLDNSLQSDPAGYGSNYHSDVHLWYHGSINLNTPMSYNLDGDAATIDQTMRSSWWDAYEVSGLRSGLYYSLMGGGNRLSPDQPLGPGFSAISDGYNYSTNRTGLPSNSGEWPNLVRFDRLDTNVVLQGGSLPMALLYQWVQPTTVTARISFYLDDDFNPLNGNGHFLGQSLVPAGASVMSGALSLPLDATYAAPGVYAIYAKIEGGSLSRYLYAPELVQVVAVPTLDISSGVGGEVQIGISASAGQTVVLESSVDLVAWQSVATNSFTTSRWVYQESLSPAHPNSFYRARLR